ncbi:hypothetical protein BpHYR1_053360 [Brachionus plicatilis]|uniref:Uncharacterized protein n=1 Tax=Brachionus plicatilis TaxID=10195 RepID=A0A3M7QW27_BRAPC|nr:hypothetical protein BpHYR1_053360 [Brachionus plicatilis]
MGLKILYISSILNYSFPCLNLFSESNIIRIQAIQNSAVRFILKLKYDTPSDILHNETFDKLKLLKVSNRLFELAERYVVAGLSHSVPLVTRLVEEYTKGFESRFIEYPTPLYPLLISFYSSLLYLTAFTKKKVFTTVGLLMLTPSSKKNSNKYNLNAPGAQARGLELKQVNEPCYLLSKNIGDLIKICCYT